LTAILHLDIGGNNLSN